MFRKRRVTIRETERIREREVTVEACDDPPWQPAVTWTARYDPGPLDLPPWEAELLDRKAAELLDRKAAALAEPAVPDHLDPLDPRFPIELGPRCDLFWAALAPWQAYPDRHPARAFAADEAAAAVEQITRREEAFTQAVPPLPGPPPVPYPALVEDTLAGEFVPLELLP